MLFENLYSRVVRDWMAGLVIVERMENEGKVVHLDWWALKVPEDEPGLKEKQEELGQKERR